MLERRHVAADLARIIDRHARLLVDLVQHQIRERGLCALDLDDSTASFRTKLYNNSDALGSSDVIASSLPSANNASSKRRRSVGAQSTAG